MRACSLLVIGLLLLGACRTSLLGDEESVTQAAEIVRGDGASPGGEDGEGGFVSRGRRRYFYAGAGGRLWYYLNCYYWAPETAPREDLWIKAEVREQFLDLERWPHGTAARDHAPKRTVEYWAVGATRRSVRLDNHKDYLPLAEGYCAGVLEVEVTLTLGHLDHQDEKGAWGKPPKNYLLESRNYRDGGGVGAERTRFEPLPREPVNVWGYRIPFSAKPQRLTRSQWQRLAVPTWSLVERR